MTPEAKDLLRSARTTLAEVVAPAVADAFALEQVKTVLRVLTHLEAVVDEAYPLERETADDLRAFLAGVARSLYGDASLADLRAELEKELAGEPAGLPPLADLRAASSRRKRLIAALIRGPLRERRGSEWAIATRAALGGLIGRQLVRERRWMAPKPKNRLDSPAMSLRVRDLKAYVPARDFELSKRFYAALGFAIAPGFGGTADVSLDGQCFRLQAYYVKDWADNFMIVMGVDDVGAWHRRAAEVIAGGAFGGARLKPPEPVGDSLVLHVIDPSGVLLIFVGGAPPSPAGASS